MSTPAGWYPDPRSPEHLRYWSGALWTEHRASAPATPPAAEVRVEAGSGAPPPIAPRSVHEAEQGRDGDAKTAGWRGYALVSVAAATVGGMGVALATRAAPRMATAVASVFMSSMAARMREGDCEPPDI